MINDMKECARCGGMFDTQMHDEGCPCMTRFDGIDAATADQGRPTGEGRAITFLVMEDLIKRTEKGIETYGEALRANNGRDALVDAYQEALDLAMYFRQVIEERQQ